MQTAFEVVAIISDKDLLNRFHRPADYARDHGERCYSVVFPDDAQGGYGTIGIPWSVAARTRADAVSYAYEYGFRFLNGARPMDVRWSKDLTEVEGSSKVTSVATFTKTEALRRLRAMAQQLKASTYANSGDKVMVTTRPDADLVPTWGRGEYWDTYDCWTLAEAASMPELTGPGMDVKFVILKKIGYGGDGVGLYDSGTLNIGSPDSDLEGVGDKPRQYGPKNRIGF